MAQDTLQRLYKAEPKTKAAVKHAYGYAVFSDLGIKILFGGTGNGKGIAVKNRTKRETFMKMIEVQAGLGMGVDKFRVVFVFDNGRAFNDFVNKGWEFGGQSTLAAKTGDEGGAMAGAVAVSDGGWMYQLTDKGLAVEISATGTKYYKDDDIRTVQQVRTISHVLHLPLLDELGPELALRWYLEGVEKCSGIKTSLEKQPPHLPRFAPELENAVYRVVQEALINVFRHSGTRETRLELAQTDGHLTISVRDDGKGFKNV